MLLLGIATGCHDDPATPTPGLADLPGSRPVVDYSTWPLGRLEASQVPPACAAPVPSQRLFRNLTPDEASKHGFGIIDGYLEVTRLGINAPTPCPFTTDEATSTAVSQAISIFLADPAAKEAYGKYGECLLDQHIDGASNPMEAELLVVKRYSTMLDAGTTKSSDGTRTGTPAGAVVKHADELSAYERRIATASVQCQAAAIAPAANRLVAAQKRVIESAPAAQKPLFQG